VNNSNFTDLSTLQSLLKHKDTASLLCTSAADEELFERMQMEKSILLSQHQGYAGVGNRGSSGVNIAAKLHQDAAKPRRKPLGDHTNRASLGKGLLAKGLKRQQAAKKQPLVIKKKPVAAPRPSAGGGRKPKTRAAAAATATAPSNATTSSGSSAAAVKTKPPALPALPSLTSWTEPVHPQLSADRPPTRSSSPLLTGNTPMASIPANTITTTTTAAAATLPFARWITKRLHVQTRGEGLKFSIHGKDNARRGLLVDAVSESGPSAGIVFSGDRIIKVEDIDITVMPNAEAMSVLGRTIKAKLKQQTFSLTVQRAAPPLPPTPLTAPLLQPPPPSSATSTSAPITPMLASSPAQNTRSSQSRLPSTTTVAAAPLAVATTTPPTTTAGMHDRSDRAVVNSTNVSDRSVVSRKRKAEVEASGIDASRTSGLKNVLAKAHRKNMLMNALLTKPEPQTLAPPVNAKTAPPAYPTTDLTLLRHSVGPTNLSAINADSSGQWRCSSADMPTSDSQELSIFLGKKIRTLGVRLVGTKSRTDGDCGIFIGRKKVEGPQNRRLLSVGDRVLKINSTDITEMGNKTAVDAIQHIVKHADSVTITVQRFHATTTTTAATAMSSRSSTPADDRQLWLASPSVENVNGPNNPGKAVEGWV
jgi:hypothetical protein